MADREEHDVPSEVMQLAAVVRDGPTPGSDGAVTEQVLVSRLRRREPSAFEALVRSHQDRVFDFCVRMVGEKEEAFDLTQEIFISIHQHLDQFRADAKLSTWRSVPYLTYDYSITRTPSIIVLPNCSVGIPCPMNVLPPSDPLWSLADSKKH